LQHGAQHCAWRLLDQLSWPVRTLGSNQHQAGAQAAEDSRRTGQKKLAADCLGGLFSAARAALAELTTVGPFPDPVLCQAAASAAASAAAGAQQRPTGDHCSLHLAGGSPRVFIELQHA